jgi:biopolymer transport protein ExbD
MRREKWKKLYYVRGLISLIILPLVFTYYVSKEIKARTFGVIPIHIADTTLSKKYPGFYSYFPPKRSYVDINFSGNIRYDRLKLDTAQLRIREILLQNDSTNGVHFRFSKNSQYGTFVKAIDILRFEGAVTYIWVDNDIWFYHFPIDTDAEKLAPKYLLGGDVILIEPQRSWLTTTTEAVKKIWKTSWQLIVGFCVFLLSSFILRILRQNKIESI